jgi:hypothetical protein
MATDTAGWRRRSMRRALMEELALIEEKTAPWFLY